ncbi:YchJ family protein [Oceanispirochaeta crateris]|jgi:SEC-C motif-containing protein|uniref:YchJ family protein n=1 Tax=Oceanispirochaeta crateris TaxID=2518645 RepID=A0A5C1QRV0_9SPIO|nr:YchJ family protein [Oceanispirochaeta crateris]QEN09354.1 YchJ family protein [Oceanispirochaeta crateris]
MAECPCGSGAEYEKCCSLYIKDGIPVPTAEKLMRARYTAYALGEVDYIMSTHEVDPKDVENSRKATEDWSKQSDWQGLEILKTSKGGESDDTGTVEFKAHYMIDRARYTHHEISTFKRKNGKWLFTEGQEIKKPVHREEPKISRNAPCPCGSGKKYKKCCG